MTLIADNTPMWRIYDTQTFSWVESLTEEDGRTLNYNRSPVYTLGAALGLVKLGYAGSELGTQRYILAVANRTAYEDISERTSLAFSYKRLWNLWDTLNNGWHRSGHKLTQDHKKAELFRWFDLARVTGDNFHHLLWSPSLQLQNEMRRTIVRNKIVFK